MREIISIQAGQCGVQLGTQVWAQYNAEHSIDGAGKKKKKDDNTSFKVFYQETNGGQFVPRNLSVDLEPNVIDDVKNGPLAGIFHP